MKSARTKAESSYSASHATKAKAKEIQPEKGGKMTKFKSLDEIPDASPDYDWGDSASPDDSRPQQSNDFEQYFIKSTVISSPVKQDVSLPSNQSRIPPLPYDQSRVTNKATNNVVSKNAPVPNSKYFDYDNGDDNLEDDVVASLPAPSPKKSLRITEPTAKAAAAMPAPPLPCDVQVTPAQSDSIYFSKKPRPVEFKPYTMKQYKMIQPKEYVEISNIKPDLNSEELVAKRANLDRVKEFSRNLQNFNRQAIAQQPKLPPAAEKHDIRLSEQKYNSSRQKALDFAKNIPKPKVAPRSTVRGGNPSLQDEQDFFDDGGAGAYATAAAGAAGMSMGADYQTESRIMELEAQHNNRKVQIEAIRRTMGLK